MPTPKIPPFPARIVVKRYFLKKMGIKVFCGFLGESLISYFSGFTVSNK
jgi:hypothetical protein